jgi:hypothetical protein
MFFWKPSIYKVTEIYCTTGEGTYDNKRRGMRFACWLHKARNTHLDYEVFILLPYQKLLRHHNTLLRVYVYFLSCFTLVIADFPLQTHNAFYIICFHQHDSTSEITYNTQASKFSIKYYVSRCIPICKPVACVNLIFQPKAMYSQTVYLYWMSIREEGNRVKYTGWGKAGGRWGDGWKMRNLF